MPLGRNIKTTYDDMDSRNELMSESYSQRSWKGIAGAVLVIAAISAIIAVIVVYAGPRSTTKSSGTLDLDLILNGYYSARSFNGTWISNEEFFYLDKMMNIQLYNATSGTSATFVHNDSLKDLGLASITVSADKKYVLLSYNATKGYRYSSEANYKIYDVQAVTIIKTLNDGQKLQYADWGPKGNQLAYVYKNNIYYMDDVQKSPISLTTDGIPEVLYNGVPDWVYEEEVLASNNAIYWSKDGNHLSYIKFDDNKVPKMNYMEYGSWQNLTNQYPTVLTIRYPKPGLSNPKVSLHVINLSDTSSTKEVKKPSQIGDEFYITAVTWSTNSTLCVVWVPRKQNRAVVSLCRLDSYQCTLTSEDLPKGWVDASYAPIFSPDGTTYFLIRSLNNDFRHLAMFNIKDQDHIQGGPENPKFLTNGTFEVTSILSYDPINKIVYYLRTDRKNDPSIRHFASVSIDTLEETCLTCNLDPACLYYGASLSPDSSFVALRCGGGASLNVLPWIHIRQLPENKLVEVLENSDSLRGKLINETLCDYIKLTVPVKGGFKALVRLYVPKDFDPNVKYPLLVSVYGGPGTQAITSTYSVNYGTYLASVKKYIYAEIDGRGSSFRGDKLMYEIYKKLGTVEIDDQIDVVKTLSNTVSYIDTSRVAIWGWSYGGYAAAMALAKGNNTFQCAISVAPVTSWYYYDSIYTERYMLTPKENLDGYKNSNLMFMADKFVGKKYLLMHGTGDDNVHVQQSMMLIKSLNAAGFLYDTHFYPDEAHSIEESKLHVYHTMENFLDECFA